MLTKVGGNSRVSHEQREEMLNFMVGHPGLATNRLNGPLATKRHLWSELAELLNSCSTGAKKTPERWAKVWQDWRCDTKQKARRIRAHLKGTGRGPALKVTSLTPQEEVLMGLIGREAADGLSEVLDPLKSLNRPSGITAISVSVDPSECMNLDFPLNPSSFKASTSPLPSPIIPSGPQLLQTSSSSYSTFPSSESTHINNAEVPSQPHQPTSRKRKRSVNPSVVERIVRAAEERASAAKLQAAATKEQAAALQSISYTFKETAEVFRDTMKELTEYLRRH